MVVVESDIEVAGVLMTMCRAMMTIVIVMTRGLGDIGGYGVDGGSGRRVREPKRRLSSTTEAKRRTSIEDEDEDEEVVHVGMEEPEALKETFPESEKASQWGRL